MTIPHDVESAFRWALENSGSAIWFIAILAGLFGFGRSRRKQQQRLTRAAMPGPPAGTAMPTAAPALGAPATTANYPPPSRVPPRAVAPVAAGTPAPAVARITRGGLLGAFGDPAHARTAVVLSELLAPPVALR